MNMASIEHDCILLAKLLIANDKNYARTATHEIMVRYNIEDNEHRVYFQAIDNGSYYMIDFYIKNGVQHSFKMQKIKQRQPFQYMYHRFI